HDHQLGLAEQRDGYAETLAHAAGVAAQLPLAGVPEGGAPQQRLYHGLPRAAVGDSLVDRDVVQQRLGANARVHPDVPRQIPERLPDLVPLAEHVQLAQANRPRVRLLKRGEDPHERGLAGAVGPEQAVHAGRNAEGDVTEGMDAVAVRLREIADLEVHRGPVRWERRRCVHYG